MAPVTLELVQTAEKVIARCFQSHPGKLVGVGDFSRATVFSQDVAARVLGVLKADNPRIERSGILVSPSAIFSLQIERLITAAANPARRCFHDPYDLKAHLGGILTREEHARLAQFLGER
ncbi:MAG TPA: hypothetical protein VIG99_10150 [Myxococcaceae bacterium]